MGSSKPETSARGIGYLAPRRSCLHRTAGSTPSTHMMWKRMTCRKGWPCLYRMTLPYLPLCSQQPLTSPQGVGDPSCPLPLYAD